MSTSVAEAITSVLNRVSQDHPAVQEKLVRTSPTYAISRRCLPIFEIGDGYWAYLVYDLPEKPIARSIPTDPGGAVAYATFEEFLAPPGGGNLSEMLIEDLDSFAV